MIRAGGLHQRQVRERLREVAEVPAGRGVELLRVEAERRGDPQQPLHQVAGHLQLADDRKRRHEPEGADQERALLAREAVVGLVRSCSAGRSRPPSALPRSPARLAFRRSSSPGRKPKIAASSVEASSASAPVVLAQDAAVVDAVRRGCPRESRRRPRPTSPARPDRRGSRPASPPDRARPSTSASKRRSAAACRAPPRSPGRARARPSLRTRPGSARVGQSRRGSRSLRRVCSRIESSAAPKTSFCRWSKAPLPTRTGLAPA